jgi:phosphoesterase RecJ-like protein
VNSNCSFAEIAEILRSDRSFVVISHQRPDGDALGSTLAVALCLRELGKSVTVWNEDSIPEKFRFLPGAGLLTKPPTTPQNFDVAIVVDNAVEKRAGSARDAIAHANCWINIDHHISNDRFGDLVYVDPIAPAVGQILYQLFRQSNLPITEAIATNLFVAISTDTGSFCYSSTTAQTYEIVADLVRAGVDVGDVSQKLYQSYPRRRLELLRDLLNVLRLSSHDRIASFSLTAETARRLQLQPNDTEGVIDHLRSIDGVVVAVFFEEDGDSNIRMSLRSKSPKIDVSKICGLFGGGGHKLAAGARTRGTLEAVEEKVLNAIHHEFEQS